MPVLTKATVIERLFEPGYVDVDHIIPYSICFDVLIITRFLCSRKKTGKRESASRWNIYPVSARHKFIVWVSNSHLPYRKKQKLLKEKITQEEIK